MANRRSQTRALTILVWVACIVVCGVSLTLELKGKRDRIPRFMRETVSALNKRIHQARAAYGSNNHTSLARDEGAAHRTGSGAEGEEGVAKERARIATESTETAREEKAVEEDRGASVESEPMPTPPPTRGLDPFPERKHRPSDQMPKRTFLRKDENNTWYPGRAGGAFSETDEPGYVADPTSAKKAAPAFVAFPADCVNHTRPKNKELRDGEWQMMNEHIHLVTPPTGPSPRILCLIYTHNNSHHKKVKAVRDTWAKDCDGFLAISNKTEPELGAVNLKHLGKQSWSNMWQKVRAAWMYTYENYYDKFDFFIMGGEDLFVSVENLRAFVTGLDPDERPLYLGRPSKQWLGGTRGGDPMKSFNLGGGGTLLNAAALKLYYSVMNTCMATLTTFAEDTKMSSCFRDNGVRPVMTRDEYGRERFHPMPPDFHWTFVLPNGTVGGWFEQTAFDLKDLTITWQFGRDCCSKESVTFHYLSPELMRRIYAILHGHCGKKQVYASGPDSRKRRL